MAARKESISELYAMVLGVPYAFSLALIPEIKRVLGKCLWKGFQDVPKY